MSTGRMSMPSRLARIVASFAVVTMLGGCVVTPSVTPSTAGPAVHDHQLTLDLRTRPTRADVGLTGDRTSRSYDQTDSKPTASGDRTRPASTARPALPAPRTCSTNRAGALGLRSADVAAAFHGSGRSQKTLTGSATGAYTIAVDLDADLSQPGDYAANLTYDFAYR